MTLLDLGGVAKGPAGMDLDSPKALGDPLAFLGVIGLQIAGMWPEELAAKLKAEASDSMTAKFEALRRAFRNLGSRKQIVERFIEETFK
jgi:hypothetical protein